MLAWNSSQFGPKTSQNPLERSDLPQFRPWAACSDPHPNWIGTCPMCFDLMYILNAVHQIDGHIFVTKDTGERGYSSQLHLFVS